MDDMGLNRTKLLREDFCRTGAGDPKNWTLDQLRTLCRATEMWPGDTIVSVSRRDTSTTFFPFAQVRLEQLKSDIVDVGGGVLPSPIDGSDFNTEGLGLEGQGFADATEGREMLLETRGHRIVPNQATQGYICIGVDRCDWTGPTTSDGESHIADVIGRRA